MEKLNIKILDSLEKCFPDESLNGKKARGAFTVFHNQPLCFQIAYRTEELIKDVPYLIRPVIKGKLAPYARIRQVEVVPSLYPADPTNYDENYLRITPGLYPDAIRPLYYSGCAVLYPRQLSCLWVDILCPDDLPAGEYALSVELISDKGKETLASREITVSVIGMRLPKQKTVHTEWLYIDCLAEQYHVQVFSEKHWKIIGNYIRTAVENGINMILTPVITPELDTYVGGERITTQLVDITVEGDGVYSFDFGKLDRWIELCLKNGVEYFEIPHFFSQWGAKNAPKIVATVNGRMKRIFGWETDALGKEYSEFLASFLPALVEHLELKGVAEKCCFHVSDEPHLVHIDHYKKCRDLIAPYLKNYTITDALSNYAFAEKGILSNPIPAIYHIQPFLDAGVSPLWTYYSGAHGCSDYTGRYLSMPSARTRIVGIQMYMNNLSGFLHWGYNFWHTKLSYDVVDPLLSTDCGSFNPSGDCFLVYPGEDGQPWESLRLNAMREAMEDIRMLELYESVFGRERTLQMVLEESGGVLTLKEYPKESDFFFKLQTRVVSDLTGNV